MTAREIAAALDALAGWVADELAGGQPPKWVAMSAEAGAWWLAAAARGNGTLEAGAR